MFIYIVRHAWAYHHGDPRWPDDSQRPLEAKGAKRFRRVMECLAERGFEPALVATSPYVRCRQTADIVAEHTSGSPEVVELESLAPGGDFDELTAWTRDHAGGRSVCWVGHAPDVGRLAAELVSDGGCFRFCKGATAAIGIEGDIGRQCGELHWLTSAKLLGV